jgi:hypothetical protein
MNKIRVGYALSRECLDLIVALARKLGLSKSGVLEMAVRKLAEAENISKD